MLPPDVQEELERLYTQVRERAAGLEHNGERYVSAFLRNIESVLARACTELIPRRRLERGLELWLADNGVALESVDDIGQVVDQMMRLAELESPDD